MPHEIVFRQMDAMKRGRPRHYSFDETVMRQLRDAHRCATNPKDKERLQAGLLAAQGVLGLDQIAQAVGRARSCIQRWLDKLVKGGVDGLLERKSAPGAVAALDEEQQRLLRAEVAQGKHRSAAQLRAWIKSKWDIELTEGGMYYWLGKLAAVLRVARPQHRKYDAQKAAEFKFSLRERLQALDLPRERPVKIWIQDEGRFGLLSFTRRVWTLRGIKPVVPVHQRYQWCYVFAALECTSGQMQAAYWSNVDLEVTGSFLQQIAASDPQAEHVIIYDGAGFHPKAGMHRLPKHVHVITLPPYSPELNPVEGLWDRLRDKVCNQVFDTLEELQEQLTKALHRYWSDCAQALSMVHGWIRRTANASSLNIIPNFN